MISARKKLNILRKVAAARFDESKHLRHPAGSNKGGQFMSKEESASIPVQSEIAPLGRPSTTLLELSAIGADASGKLSTEQITKLNLIRNGRDSFEEFLDSAPESVDKFATLFAGERVNMGMSTRGAVYFMVDESTSNYDDLLGDSPKPSKELAEMAQIFTEFLSRPVGKRYLSCEPTYDTFERFAARVKHYQKNGFVGIPQLIGFDDFEEDEFPMFLDNRHNPKTFIPAGYYDQIQVKGRLWRYSDESDDEAREF